jgi:hypothetical protein
MPKPFKPKNRAVARMFRRPEGRHPYQVMNTFRFNWRSLRNGLIAQ